MIEATVFIGLVIIALTDLYRYIRDKNWQSAFTIGVAALIGLLVGLIDTQIGIANITVAQGILDGLSAAGIVTIAKRV